MGTIKIEYLFTIVLIYVIIVFIIFYIHQWWPYHVIFSDINPTMQ